METLNTIMMVYGYFSAFCGLGIALLVANAFLYEYIQKSKEKRAMSKLLRDHQKDI